MTIDVDPIKILERLDELAETVAEIRALVAGNGDPAPAPEVTPLAEKGSDEVDWTLRGLKFLKPFYDAPGRSLHKSAASQAAKDAGYDPRGTAGFYVGNGSLVKVGDYRVLTDVGANWFEENSPHYPEAFGDE